MENRSQLETRFQCKQILKRGRPYTNQQYSPKNQFKKSTPIDQNFQRSFINTSEAVTSKLNQSINKFVERCKNRKSFSGIESQTMDNSVTNSISQIYIISFYNANIIPMEKQLNRKSFINQNVEASSQRVFHNFKQKQIDRSHTPDLGKLTPRTSIMKIQLNEYQIKKAYQTTRFDNTTQKCVFQYYKQKKEPRKFFIKRRQENICATDLTNQQVKYAFENTRKKITQPVSQFYRSSGRQLPPSIILKNMTPLQNYWSLNGKYIRKSEDPVIKNNRKQLLWQRLNKRSIKHNLKPEDYCVQIQMRRGI